MSEHISCTIIFLQQLFTKYLLLFQLEPVGTNDSSGLSPIYIQRNITGQEGESCVIPKAVANKPDGKDKV